MKSLKISFVLWLSSMVLPVFADTVMYFGLINQIPTDVTAQSKVCILDDANQLLATINNDLKNQPNISKEIIAKNYAAQFQKISNSMVCQTQAAQLGITQLPAVVLNDHYVVYGQTSMHTALLEIQAFKEAQHVG